jgi:hypothetical protein
MTVASTVEVMRSKMKESFKPYQLLALCGLFILSVSFFLPFNFFDLKLNGEFYVFSWSEFSKYVAAYFLSIFTIACFLRSFLTSTLLSRIHVLLSIAIPVAALYFIFEASKPYWSDSSRLKYFHQNNNVLKFLFYAFLTVQVLLPVNALMGSGRKSGG